MAESDIIPSSMDTSGGDVSLEDLLVPEKKYEYLDHPADVQLHAWGNSIRETFEQVAISMFAYMTDIETVDMTCTYEIEAEGHDMESLLFNFLDEFLFAFCVEPNFISRVCCKFFNEVFIHQLYISEGYNRGFR